MKRRIVPGGILALGLAVVLLAATASTASAFHAPGTILVLSSWNCPPPSTPPTTIEEIEFGTCLGPPRGSFDFGDRQVGTVGGLRFLLWVSGETFTPRISVSGDYAQTNNCPPTLSAGGGPSGGSAYPPIQGCVITVRFTPTGTGPRRGTLSTGTGVIDLDDDGSEQLEFRGPTAALTGNGVTTPTPSPDLQLSGKKKQHPTMRTGRGCGPFSPSTDCSVKVKASCGVDACTARAKGKLTKVKNDKLQGAELPIVPGETRTLKLRLTKKMREKALKAVDKGKNVQAKVTVRATDAAGNVATAKRTITLK